MANDTDYEMEDRQNIDSYQNSFTSTNTQLPDDGDVESESTDEDDD